MRGDPLADRARLADVERLAIGAVEEVDAGRIGQLAALLRDPFRPRELAVVGACAHGSKSRLLATRPKSPAGEDFPDTTESEMTPETLTSAPPELNTLRIEIDGEIATLTLDRPDAFNAMSPELIGELTLATGYLADTAPIRALVITGAGRAFCSGGDIN